MNDYTKNGISPETLQAWGSKEVQYAKDTSSDEEKAAAQQFNRVVVSRLVFLSLQEAHQFLTACIGSCQPATSRQHACPASCPYIASQLHPARAATAAYQELQRRATPVPSQHTQSEA